MADVRAYFRGYLTDFLLLAVPQESFPAPTFDIMTSRLKYHQSDSRGTRARPLEGLTGFPCDWCQARFAGCTSVQDWSQSPNVAEKRTRKNLVACQKELLARDALEKRRDILLPFRPYLYYYSLS